MPAAVVRWCTDALGEPVLDVSPLVGGITGAIWRVRTPTRHVILRWLGPDHPHVTDAADWVQREALGCRLTEGTRVPSPTLIASDPNGAATGGWANLTTFLPGLVRLDRLGPPAVDALAALAVAVHAVEVAGTAERPRPFNDWVPRDVAVPAWASRPALWAEAIERCAAPPPATPFHFVHRDFHPGNVLWEGDAVTGLIDWAESAWGPSDLDVAHACANFAMLHTVDDALAFRAAYEGHGGRLDPDPDARRYWVCLDAIAFLPEPMPIVSELVRRRPDLDHAGVHRRLEDVLEVALRG